MPLIFHEHRRCLRTMSGSSTPKLDTANSSTATIDRGSNACNLAWVDARAASGSFTSKPDTARSSTATLAKGTHTSNLPSLDARLEGKETPFSPSSTVVSRPPSPQVDEEDPDKVTWDGPDDPQNPQNWSNQYRWLITISCVVMTFNV